MKAMTGLSFLSMMALAAAMTGCSGDAGELSEPGSSTTPVELTVSFEDVKASDASTRADDGYNIQSTGFSDTSGGVWVCVDNGSGTYSDYQYTISGANALTTPTTGPVFPAGVNTVHVYALYPYNSKSLTYTVNTDQTIKANYCLSDVMGATNADCVRSASSGTWSVTPANLTFKHLLSKLKLTVTPGTGVKITSVKMKTIKKDATITVNKTSNAASSFSVAAGSSTQDITLYSNNSGSSTAVTTVCVFPPQTIAASTTFIEVTGTYNGGTNTIRYSMASAKTFASDKVYTASMTVNGGTGVTLGTITVSDWTGSESITVSGDKDKL